MYKELWLARMSNSPMDGFVDNDTTVLYYPGLTYWTKLTGKVYFNACTTCYTTFVAAQKIFEGCAFDELHLPRLTTVNGGQLLGGARIKKIFFDSLTTLPSQFGRSIGSVDEIHFSAMNVDTVVTALNSSDYFMYVSDAIKSALTIYCDGGNIIWNGSAWAKAQST